MSFFNNKEEVIDIVLTPIGKKAMSDGVFNPKYYSFFDEDIIYNGETYGLLEKQNSIQERILNETPYLKLQTRYSSSVDSISIHDQFNFLGFSLGNAEDSEQKYPSFLLKFRDSDIDSVNLSGTQVYNTFSSNFIPQINLKEKMVEIIVEKDFSKMELKKDEYLALGPKPDNSYVKIRAPEISLELSEENVQKILKKFDVEVYKIQNESMEKLVFEKKENLFQQDIENDFLVSSNYTSTSDVTISDPEFATDIFLEEDLAKVKSYFYIGFDTIQTLQTADAESQDKLFIYDAEVDILPSKGNC
jgi:hypothetical protein